MKLMSPLSRMLMISGMVCGLALNVDAREVSGNESGQSKAAASSGMPVFVKNISPDAEEAVKVVDAFNAALKAVKLDEVSRLLDEKVLVLESGGSERSRDEYLAKHATADSLFLQKAHIELRYRQAHAEGNLAWVGSESTVLVKENEKESLLKMTETMLLKKTPDGWKIVHIHWSSRPAVKS